MNILLRVRTGADDLRKILDEFCTAVNRNALYGPDERQLAFLKLRLSENYPDADIKSISPIEFLEGVRKDLKNILANMLIEDENLASLIPKIDLKAFQDSIPNGDKRNIPTLIVRNKNRFLEEVSKQSGIDMDRLQETVDNGKYPVGSDYPVAGVWIKQKQADIASMYYYYAKDDMEKNADVLARYSFKAICKDAQRAAKIALEQEEEREAAYER